MGDQIHHRPDAEEDGILDFEEKLRECCKIAVKIEMMLKRISGFSPIPLASILSYSFSFFVAQVSTSSSPQLVFLW
jgi:hypothetical protein